MGRRTEAVTVSRAEEYLRGNASCPYCGSWNVGQNPPHACERDRRVYVEYACGGCGGRWNEVYALTGIEAVERDSRAVTARFNGPAPGVLVEVNEGSVRYTACGEVGVVLVDWEDVADAVDPGPLRDLIAEVEVLPADCDEGRDTLRALRERLAAVLAGD